jgi:hypothetical protein
VISSSGRYDYVGRFAYTGTRDYTPLAVLPTALEFIEKNIGGMQAYRQYCRDLLREGCQLLIEKWKSSYLVCAEYVVEVAMILKPFCCFFCAGSI